MNAAVKTIRQLHSLLKLGLSGVCQGHMHSVEVNRRHVVPRIQNQLFYSDS